MTFFRGGLSRNDRQYKHWPIRKAGLFLALTPSTDRQIDNRNICSKTAYSEGKRKLMWDDLYSARSSLVCTLSYTMGLNVLILVDLQ